jgi:hypothetical protein
MDTGAIITKERDITDDRLIPERVASSVHDILLIFVWWDDLAVVVQQRRATVYS